MKSNYTLFTVLLLLYSIIGYSQPTSQVFSTPGFWTYTVPAGYKANITVEAWGGGGGGGGSSAGRGGGGYVTNTYLNVLPGDYDITVGSGGAVGSVGGTSSYKFIGTISAGGGAGAVGNSGGGVAVFLDHMDLAPKLAELVGQLLLRVAVRKVVVPAVVLAAAAAVLALHQALALQLRVVTVVPAVAATVEVVEITTMLDRKEPHQVAVVAAVAAALAHSLQVLVAMVGL